MEGYLLHQKRASRLRLCLFAVFLPSFTPAVFGKPPSIKLAKQRKIVIIHQWSTSQPLKKNTADKINSL